MNQSVMVFSNSTARAAALTAPVEGMLTYLEDTASYESYDGTAWIGFGGGSGIVQVVTASNATQVYTTSTSFQETNLTATITPTSATNKILVLISQPIAVQHNSAGDYAGGKFITLRGATQIDLLNVVAGVRYGSGNVLTLGFNYNVGILDSPATTAATTYKTQMKRDGGTGVYAQNDNQTSTITLIEMSA